MSGYHPIADGLPRVANRRAMLDPVEPKLFFPVFDTAFEAMDECGGLAAFRQLGRHVLIALDGTEYFRSNDIRCSNCSTRARSGGKTEYFHTFLSATMVAPGHNRVVSLPPEFISPQGSLQWQNVQRKRQRRSRQLNAN
jgi:hypothetical protein